jgi:hypothetical protein
MASEEFEGRLLAHREDFTRVNGRPFQHFFCPLLMRDEETQRCLGHIVPQSIPNSRRSCVVQRADVDNFYGVVAEGDLSTLLAARAAGTRGLLFDPELSKKIKHRFTVGGEAVEHYHDKGHRAPQHTPLVFESDQGDAVRLVLKKSNEELVAALGQRWQVTVDGDFRISSVVALIKSGFLSMFHLLGYHYAESAAGLAVGYGILGDFYRKHDGDAERAKSDLKNYFRRYSTMVRPLHVLQGEGPRGTIEDYRTQACFGGTGRPFALVVFVRTGEALHAVLMPASNHPESMAAYWEFMTNDREEIWIHECRLDLPNGCWQASSEPTRLVWPKRGPTFQFD